MFNTKRFAPLVFFLALCLMPFRFALADFAFEDTRFQGSFTTENLNRIIEEYELHDGWYWSDDGQGDQTFHGRLDKPGWTASSDKVNHRAYLKGWYGARWGINRITLTNPGRGGYGECYGFAQFIGYLISGEKNPQHHWKFYYSLEDAGGLKVGDIVRDDYQWDGIDYQHSAVVYAVNGDEVTFIQASGSSYNRISVGIGFSDGFYTDVRYPEDLAALPFLKISRSPLNQ